MATSSTSTVYVQVIQDVISNVRDEFINNGGPGEGVLTELQGLWELKMMQAGAIFGPIDRSSMKLTDLAALTKHVHDLNVPYEGPEEYETPTADLLFPPTPLQTPMQTPFPFQTPLPGTAPTPLPGTVVSSYDIPTGGTPFTPNDYPPVNNNGASESRSGRPSPNMQPPPWLNQSPPLDVNIAYTEGREQDFFQLSSGKRKREDFPSQYLPGGYIPQQDGSGDLIADNSEIYNYQGAVNEDYNVANTPALPELQTQTPAMVDQNDLLDDDDEEEPLNENDDDDLDDVDQGDEVDTYYIILAQFDKVTRAKSKWKCSLKNGVMHINNKDVLFSKASGEFDF
ncbi:hypothetical protein L1887_12431 [Cichorium endivia]|nr:hypothetical protein L1887_12431 [Cichorium endivia]